MQVLTGDIGGTNTRLAMVELAGGRLQVGPQENYPSTQFNGLTEIISHFQETRRGSPPAAAAFGVAGPVHNGVSRITNLPWVISAQELAKQLGIASVHVLNDLEALAWGVDTLEADQVVSLQAGMDDPSGHRAIIAAGTGLGQAGLFFDGTMHRPFATEGGHSDFAPETEQDWRLLQFLQKRFGHVSWERLVSGPGLETLYEFLLLEAGSPAPDWLQDPQRDGAAIIAENALSQSDQLCSRTLHWFIRLYGSEAGNLALKLKPAGGLYLGGGIAPKILPALQKPTFLEAFLNKGRMRVVLERLPVRVICNEQVSLQGLARFAALAAG